MDSADQAWEPTINNPVVLYPGTDEETTGLIIDDYGEFTAHSVDIGGTHIADPARRWAVHTTNGSLEFVDTEHLVPPHTNHPGNQTD